MKRVVITGLGAATTLGLDLKTIETTLREGKSCLSYCPDYAAHGFKCHVAGWLAEWNASEFFTKKALKTMGRASEFTAYAAIAALKDSQLSAADVQSDRCGVLVGCGEGSSRDMFEAATIMATHNNPRKMGIRVPKTMASSRSSNITMLIKNEGVSFGISDACATGLVNIGYAYQLVKWGVQDLVFAGGGESCDWTGGAFFDAMGVVPTQFNHQPAVASRPFDRDRQGFVMGEGGGIVVVEERDRALSRGAPIYGEIVGYATNCDGGASMVAPSPAGQAHCMEAALKDAHLPPAKIDYINAHGTSTKRGDVSEIAAIRQVMGSHTPMLTSVKSQIGHTIGAAGAIELITTLLMMKRGFVAPSINIEQLDEACAYPNIVTATKEVQIDTALTNNFAFGGSNATMIVRSDRWAIA